MPSRFLLSPIAAALCLGTALAAEPGPAVVVAQLGPTSPGFRMDMKRGETGAPEATAVGATPIERRSAGGTVEWRSGSSHPSAKKDEQEHASDAKADDHKPAGATSAKAEPAKGAASGSAMDSLREKLAARLGATPSPNGRYAMQVSNRGESGENVITSVRPSAAAVAAARRKRAAAAPGDANMDIAANAGQSLLPTHWDYEGSAGPESWGKLRPEYSKCASGQRQSPIDIRGGIAVDLEPIRFDYRPSGFSVIDNGHTVQVNVEPGNAITITGKRYELVQFHFHRPSEERINGRQYDMVAHLVHKDADGRLAVVAVLLDRGSAQAIVQSVWNNLPLEKGDEVRAGTRIDMNQLLPEDKRYYTYMGSLTTPPCSEGVLWMVLKQPVPISVEQVAIFSRLYPMNARPIQQADGRLIKESN
ncbi:MAG TPA: carbonic anhydrase family protein [Burkholderiaceae bacterium]